ncbi:MAG: AGE family epimerase/isomerase [Bosea sp. (in: a-proteobacteria)]|uniref:AGE family epimerase/isomerase n=1 Tax=Bosea sp. (in: a-proteobacteria) TaxID=1871050 RepID=UPI0027329523|nr:AGE family epimerase/isomerase [Bosea sp. (in: a-proteobacteria)]MDP3257427.1 AGE family epimerase/isomerase [Bosea sp. (in: a-proteobacteria)]MDP3319954.1 AGE family epimerase/isomerase [Bosea sp. (in: a-proteobacteria)]
MQDFEAGTIESWLTGTLLPGWLHRVWSADRPGYVEMVSPDGLALESDARSTLVTARLAYVFSHAHLLGVPGTLDAARHGMDFLWHGCRRPEGHFSHRCTARGEPVDPKSDFYDLAFVLFACGWFARASGESVWLERAEAVMGFIQTTLAHPEGGFAEDTLGSLPRRQNPHMHLLEACHALAESGGGDRWLARAESLVRLMQERMLDAGTGSLGEFFTEDWQPAAGRAGQIREPGHHYEWTWLLHHHDRLTGDRKARAAALSLYSFADRYHGRDPAHAVVNEIAPDGSLLDGACLLWPQTEYLKALAVRVEFEHDAEAAARLDPHLALVFTRFVDRGSGLWINRIDAAGAPDRGAVPVRVLYHLLLAMVEVVRVKRLVAARV